MPKIDPEELKQIERGTIIQEIKNANGLVIGYKGRFLPDVYDNYTECLRENARASEVAELKKRGLNEHGQTKDQAEKFARRVMRSQQIKEKADVALAMTEKTK